LILVLKHREVIGVATQKKIIPFTGKALNTVEVLARQTQDIEFLRKLFLRTLDHYKGTDTGRRCPYCRLPREKK
jgi:hypothetical protein